MKGDVLHYDDNLGTGLISGADGNRYTFTRADMKQLVPVGRGTKVDFDFEGKQAKDIFIDAQAASAGAVPHAPAAAAAPASTALPPKIGFLGHFTRFYTTNFARFSGRAGRKEYWSVLFFGVLICTLLSALIVWGVTTRINGMMNGELTTSSIYQSLFISTPAAIGSVVLIAFLVLSFIPSVALLFRRLHDIGWPGFIGLILLALVVAGEYYKFRYPWAQAGSIITGVAMLVIAFFPGQHGDNKYGPQPR